MLPNNAYLRMATDALCLDAASVLLIRRVLEAKPGRKPKKATKTTPPSLLAAHAAIRAAEYWQARVDGIGYRVVVPWGGLAGGHRDGDAVPPGDRRVRGQPALAG